MPVPIFIRQAQREHVGDIREINAESAPGVYSLTSDALDHIFDTASVGWVALVNERVAGYLIGFAPHAAYGGEEFRWFRSRIRDFLYVDQIAVRTSHRSQGIGMALYQELEVFAERNQLSALACEVNLDPPNPGSMAFHTRQGFMEIGRLGTSDGRHVALLRKQRQAAGQPGRETLERRHR
jgi:predicted GNAT superfamily acetyltransferase